MAGWRKMINQLKCGHCDGDSGSCLAQTLPRLKKMLLEYQTILLYLFSTSSRVALRQINQKTSKDGSVFYFPGFDFVNVGIKLRDPPKGYVTQGTEGQTHEPKKPSTLKKTRVINFE
jgi:hypothetical protein